MYISLPIALGFLAVTALGSQQYTHFDCGTDLSSASPDFVAYSHELHTKQLNSPVEGGSYDYEGAPGARKRAATVEARAVAAGAAAKAITVNTYFHIVTAKSEAGKITQAMANNQLAAMNKVYNKYNVKFVLKGTDFTVNDTWAAGATSADDLAMKRALRKGNYSTLNIYFQTDLAGNVLGKCTLPGNMTGNVPAIAYANDGCNVQANTMPGGNIGDYNLGQTAVHETGHWLGLLHVFEGYTCDPKQGGDLIADTPQQSIATDGCPVNPAQDSCPTQPGVDAIHNVMDYSTDACYTGFTANQISRIQSMWPWRQGH